MPFETVPFLHGRYFNYREYFMLLAVSGEAFWALLCAAIGFCARRRAQSLGMRMGIAEQPLHENLTEIRATEGSSTSNPQSALVSPEIADASLVLPSPELARVVPGTAKACKHRWASACAYVLLAIGGPLCSTACVAFGLGDYNFLPFIYIALILSLPSLAVICCIPFSFNSGFPIFGISLFHLMFIIAEISWFDYLNVWLCWFLISASLIPIFRIVKWGSSPSHRWWLFTVLGACSLAFPLSFAGWGVCLSLYTEGSQGTIFSVLDSAFVSTRWSRKPYSCEHKGQDPSTPCHVYLTLAENASSSVFVNMHMAPGNDKSNHVRVYATCEDEVGGDSQKCSGRAASARFFAQDYLNDGSRDVYSAFVDGLQSGMNYRLVLEVSGKNLTSLPHWRFTTAPAHGEDVDLVFCGDMGSSAHASALMDISVGLSSAGWLAPPAAFVIGGDIAYDNGMHTCWCVWEDWLDRWDSAMISAQRLVPLLFAVGNHDVGIEAVANVVPPPVDKGKLPYFSFFPFQEVEQNVPAVNDRDSYHMHRIGDALVLALDSGYIEASDPKSKQLVWARSKLLESASDPSQPVAILATYHVPIYSSKMEDYHEFGAGPSGAFISLFDSFYVPVAFENHVHAFKRTIPMRSSKFDRDGTIYVGDGRAGLHGLGVPSEPKLFEKKDESRFAVNSLARDHIWHTKVTSYHAFLQAIDVNGTVFDSFHTEW